jgi:hypothetical protein
MSAIIVLLRVLRRGSVQVSAFALSVVEGPPRERFSVLISSAVTGGIRTCQGVEYFVMGGVTIDGSKKRAIAPEGWSRLVTTH